MTQNKAARARYFFKIDMAWLFKKSLYYVAKGFANAWPSRTFSDKRIFGQKQKKAARAAKALATCVGGLLHHDFACQRHVFGSNLDDVDACRQSAGIPV